MTDKTKIVLIGVSALAVFVVLIYLGCLVNEALRGTFPGKKRASCFTSHKKL